MPITVDTLGVPPMDLSITDTGNGKFKVELNVPSSSGSINNTPFLEVTRNEHSALINGARQSMIAELSQSGFTIGDINFNQGGHLNNGGGAGVSGQVPGVGKAWFEVTMDAGMQTGVNGSIKNNPDVEDAIRRTEQNFDTRRQDIYEARAREWYGNGGATMISDGETYKVTPEACRTYINERHPINIFERVDNSDPAILASAVTDHDKSLGNVATEKGGLAGPEELQRKMQQYVEELNGFMREGGFLNENESIASRGHNDAYDAMRHAYVTGRFSEEYGSVAGQAYGLAHEISHPNDKLERDMDLHNNRMGAQYSGETTTPRELYDRVIEGYVAGELVEAPGLKPSAEYKNLDKVDPESKAGKIVSEMDRQLGGNSDTTRIVAAAVDQGMNNPTYAVKVNDGYVVGTGNPDHGNRVHVTGAALEAMDQNSAVAKLNQSINQPAPQMENPALAQEQQRSSALRVA
jgi:hypothetical protein